jgi:hypothetical protein
VIDLIDAPPDQAMLLVGEDECHGRQWSGQEWYQPAACQPEQLTGIGAGEEQPGDRYRHDADVGQFIQEQFVFERTAEQLETIGQ